MCSSDLGGYVAFPGGLMAAFLRRPLVIHEQNSVAGLTNRVLAKLAQRTLTAFPNSFKNKHLGEWIGNPVRADIRALHDPQSRYASRSGVLQLLVVGGSLGASVLNEMMPKALALIPEAQRPRVTHQAGATHIDALRKAYTAAGVQAETLEIGRAHV